MHEHNQKKYIEIFLPPCIEEKVQETHVSAKKFIKPGFIAVNPKNETGLQVKVPYKYNRVTCAVLGQKPVQALEIEDCVRVTIQYCGVWNASGYGGPSWKLLSLEQISFIDKV